jgi:hypothetical protein
MGSLASGKSVPACSPEEKNKNTLEEDVSGLFVRKLYLPSVIKA